MNKLLWILLLSTSSMLFAATPYVGANAGYMLDSETGFYSARMGLDFARRGIVVHALEGEIGYSRTRSDQRDPMIPPQYWTTARSEMTSFLLNYRATLEPSASRFSYSLGGGLGTTRWNVSQGRFEDRKEAFTLQARGGVEYAMTPKIRLGAAVRYLWFDEITFFSRDYGSSDDVVLETAIRIAF
ncbi:outer membrane protein [Opitutus terrae]|uniref:Outer membrane protein beta-barrel domain-containing protein n=1 Tax=Opitutus terrae (strain DSM 11246 / JCM 15787 / PB90-1) TaxID=452637 RepID=B1ZX90_OPITP|nr:outer membrane beta-barrel protein [Opitutus terrae]ACB76142.1 hypothetical protein Oter_2861 [Opitutus terrae PB90-1]